MPKEFKIVKSRLIASAVVFFILGLVTLRVVIEISVRSLGSSSLVFMAFGVISGLMLGISKLGKTKKIVSEWEAKPSKIPATALQYPDYNKAFAIRHPALTIIPPLGWLSVTVSAAIVFLIVLGGALMFNYKFLIAVTTTGGFLGGMFVALAIILILQILMSKSRAQ